MMENDDNPYLAEYAKSNRSLCKHCTSHIAKDSLRIALVVQSHRFDGKETRWHHFSCFFGKFRPKAVDEITNYHTLRWEDQEKVRIQIEKGPTASKGKQGKAKSLSDFVIQYALSGKSTCKKCGEKIAKEEIRISHKEIDPEKAFLGPIDRWHHVGCFIKHRHDLEWNDEYTADMLTNFKSLDAGDRQTIKNLLEKKKKKKGKKSEPSTSKKETDSDPIDAELTKKLREQSKLLWKMIDTLKKNDVSKSELVDILECNDQLANGGIDSLYERVADGMVFGKLPKCSVCKNGRLVVSSKGYYACKGDLSEWTKCTFTSSDLPRKPWVFPADLKETYPVMKKYKFQARTKVFPPKEKVKPLKKKFVVLLGKLSKRQNEIKEIIESLGGSVTSSVTKAHFCISTAAEVESKNKKMNSVKLNELFVVSEDFLSECETISSKTESLLPLLTKHSLAPWGKERIDESQMLKRVLSEKNEEKPKKLKLIVADGSAVDPESQLQNSTKVVIHDGMKFTATLSMVNVQSGINSYYKLQLLASTTSKRWKLFRSWGRVGTSIGGTKIESFANFENALNSFNDLYTEKTGNFFGCTNFIKQPGLFYPVEIDYGADQAAKVNWEKESLSSTLPKSVQNLIRMIFDIETMKKTMMEYEIDLNKMPLGKLSKRQMQKAYAVLTEASELMKSGELNSGKMLDCTNRFFTLIPHNFGISQPPLLNNEDIIKSRVAMLDSLMDIELAYNFLSVKQEEGTENIIDASFEKLNCAIKPLDREADDFKMIEEYVKSTHASTHNQYKLEIEHVFVIGRKGEATRFRPFQALPNRKLLWHGSRTSNYAGILSQGLRIAPPEAPVTGYMFGKGIYFADMVSKSANYCGASTINSRGLCLLADVALGKPYELTNADPIQKLPKGKHSVKGVGITEPDPSSHVQTLEGYTVPIGRGIKSDLSKYDDKSSLLYNEYIVYDVAQVHLKYLVQFKFCFSTLW